MLVQVGYDKQGLPIGLQLIGRPWGEATILRLASAVEVQTSFILLLSNIFSTLHDCMWWCITNVKTILMFAGTLC